MKKCWLTDGDNNTTYFHIVINKCKNDFVRTMRLENGTSLATPEEIHMGAVQHFQNFLTEVCDTKEPDLDDLINVEITDEENEILILRTSKLDLKKVLESIPKHCSLSLDAFGSKIFMACWNFIKEDLHAGAQIFQWIILAQVLYWLLYCFNSKGHGPDKF